LIILEQAAIILLKAIIVMAINVYQVWTVNQTIAEQVTVYKELNNAIIPLLVIYVRENPVKIVMTVIHNIVL
jgi:hypothetical protein